MSYCRKNRFQSRAEAKAYARRVKTQNGHHQLYPYRCRECDGWHLTHWTPREQRRRFPRAA